MAQAAKKAAKKAAKPAADAGAIRVFFATNRNPTGDPPSGFGNLPNGQHAELRFGEGAAAIPAPGQFLRSIPVVSGIQIYPEDIAAGIFGSAYLFSVLDRLALDDRNDAVASVLLYVHGFATSFPEALGCAAQIRNNIAAMPGGPAGTRLLPPIPIAFSWPSDGVVLAPGGPPKAYWNDEGDAFLSGSALVRLLARLSAWADARFSAALQIHADAGGGGEPPRRVPINVMVQSMGHQVLAGALHLAGGQPLRLDHVVSSGGDIEARALTANGALSPLSGIARSITVYNNINDGALSASQTVHQGAQRLGQTGPQMPLAGANVVSVDVTQAVNFAWNVTGHFYNRVSQPVCGDYVQVLADTAAYAVAGRQAIGSDGQHYVL